MLYENRCKVNYGLLWSYIVSVCSQHRKKCSSSFQSTWRSSSSPDIFSHHYKARMISYLWAPWEPRKQKHKVCVSSQQLKNEIVDNSFSFHFTAPPACWLHKLLWVRNSDTTECVTVLLAPESPYKPGNLFSACKMMPNWSGWLPESWVLPLHRFNLPALLRLLHKMGGVQQMHHG